MKMMKERKIYTCGISTDEPVKCPLLEDLGLEEVVDRQRAGQDKRDSDTQAKGGLYVLRYCQEGAHPQVVGEDHVIDEDRPKE